MAEQTDASRVVNRDLSSLTLDQLRNLDRIAMKYRGCRYADLLMPEVRQLLAEINAEAAVKEAYVIVLEEWHRIRAERARH